MNHIPDIPITDFDYILPEYLIAEYPEKERDRSKLLVRKADRLFNDSFFNLPDYIEKDSIFVFNDTKVINARLIFQKPSGSVIEIFVLEPVLPSSEINIAFNHHSGVAWKCMVGNLKRWKTGTLTILKNIMGRQYELHARIIERYTGTCLIEFLWSPEETPFSVILDLFGIIPLPPYIHRHSENSDLERYQTIYAHFEGSVAAPTAGLHFSQNVFEKLKMKNAGFEYLTLHVGAGTFKPVENGNLTDHQMHQERIIVGKRTIFNLLNQNGPVIAVGTTSVRTLESMYLYALKLVHYNKADFHINQFDPYQIPVQNVLTRNEALRILLEHLEVHQLEYLSGLTTLMIMPGYQFKMIDGMVTNFHLPKSTLLLLISAFIGNEWKQTYEYAISNNYRFLSYGDACLFLR